MIENWLEPISLNLISELTAFMRRINFATYSVENVKAVFSSFMLHAARFNREVDELIRYIVLFFFRSG